jgi:hypothetical protein
LQTRRATAGIFCALAACGGGEPVARIHTTGAVVEVTLEVADTPEARQRGLMYRSTLADGRGMLFVFDEDADHQFWMKNTLIPLDLVFIDRGGRVVGVHADATPLSLAPIRAGTPSRYVLEVPGGFAARRGIAAGDRVDLDGVRAP